MSSPKGHDLGSPEVIPRLGTTVAMAQHRNSQPQIVRSDVAVFERDCVLTVGPISNSGCSESGRHWGQFASAVTEVSSRECEESAAALAQQQFGIENAGQKQTAKTASQAGGECLHRFREFGFIAVLYASASERFGSIHRNRSREIREFSEFQWFSVQRSRRFSVDSAQTRNFYACHGSAIGLGSSFGKRQGDRGYTAVPNAQWS